MPALHIAIVAIWALFWIYWIASAFGAKASTGRIGTRELPLRALTGILIVLFLRVSDTHGMAENSLAVHSPVLEAVGITLLVGGLSFAVWARLHLGSNWGMPMTRRLEPELITSGPYRHVRHPIYSGLLLGAVGSVLAIDLIGFGVVILLTLYFLIAGRVEERDMAAAFPDAYPAYKARSKMLIPFLL